MYTMEPIINGRNCNVIIWCFGNCCNNSHIEMSCQYSTYCFSNLKIPMMNTKHKSLFVFKSSDKIIVNPVTVFITIDNECMILEIFMMANRFYCVCDQMWFVNWLRRTNVTLIRGPYICVQPQELMRAISPSCYSVSK
jgi:hypothetical protein